MRGRAAGARPEGEGGTAGLAVLKYMGPALAEEGCAKFAGGATLVNGC